MVKIGIVGYGNLGRACERIAVESKDFDLIGIFTRRNPDEMVSPLCSAFYHQNELENFIGKIDVLALCTGSAGDLVDLGKRAVLNFNTVDSFDTHAKMRDYVFEMNGLAKANDRLSFIGIGWDPGVFSLMRALFDGLLNDGSTVTFWGKGVSQGHSEAIRKIDGVLNGIQYTIPKEDALNRARQGDIASLTTKDKHLRECFVVAKSGADLKNIEAEIVSMPNYFAEYDTVVHFISEEDFAKNHNAMPHGGFVLRGGNALGENTSLEFALKLNSNPNFTATVLMNYARANAKLYNEGVRGAKTVLDIPVSALLSGNILTDIERFV